MASRAFFQIFTSEWFRLNEKTKQGSLPLSLSPLSLLMPRQIPSSDPYFPHAERRRRRRPNLTANFFRPVSFGESFPEEITIHDAEGWTLT